MTLESNAFKPRLDIVTIAAEFRMPRDTIETFGQFGQIVFSLDRAPDTVGELTDFPNIARCCRGKPVFSQRAFGLRGAPREPFRLVPC